MWPSTSWPLSSLTLNIVLGRASVISPSISIFSSFAMRRGAYRTASSAAQGLGAIDCLIPTAHLARVLGGLQLGQELADLGPLADPEHGRQLVAAQQRLGRTLPAPIERVGEHLPGQLQVGLDRLLGRERT